MGIALGLIEYKSVAKGLAATNIMLKAANVNLITANVLCPGKFVALISGDVGAVQTAVRTGFHYDSAFAISQFVLPNAHVTLLPALTATTQCEVGGAIGIIETIDVSSAVIAGDTVAKAANVSLMEIRLARGMGGKAVVFLTGELDSVQTAVRAATGRLRDEGVLIATEVVSSPHPKLTI